MIRFHATLIREKLVAHEHDSYMSDEGIIVTALDLFCQLQVLLGHFEEHFDIPPLAVDPDDIFVRKVDIGGKERKPIFFTTIADKNHLGHMFVFERDENTGQDICPASAFFQVAIDGHQVTAAPLKTIEDFRCLFYHADNRQMLTDVYNGCRHTEPTVHKDRASVDTRSTYPFDHIRKESRALRCGLLASLVGTTAFIHDLGFFTKSFGGIGR